MKGLLDKVAKMTASERSLLVDAIALQHGAEVGSSPGLWIEGKKVRVCVITYIKNSEGDWK